MDDDARGDASSPWPKLPVDVLSEVASRLHDAGDFVRFRAACRPWHEALPPARAPSFLPWIIEAYDSSIDDQRALIPCVVESYESTGDPRVRVTLRSPFSTRRTRQHLLPLPAIRGMSIQGSDASGGRVLAVGYSDEGRTAALVNPLDGHDAASLPPLPRSKSPRDRWGSASGVVVSSNGAVVFHNTLREDFFAAIQLRPGEPGWEEVDVPSALRWRMRFLDEDERRAAALWSSALVPGVACRVAALPPRPLASSDRYVLEFRGELLCADVVFLENSFSVQVHTMRVEDDGWRRRGDMDHLCLFLGLSSSFAIDAREFAGSAEVTGGCAYFFLRRRKEREELLGGAMCVYRYSFQSGTTTFVDDLPTLVIPVWFMPRPRMSPLPPRVHMAVSQ